MAAVLTTLRSNALRLGVASILVTFLWPLGAASQPICENLLVKIKQKIFSETAPDATKILKRLTTFRSNTGRDDEQAFRQAARDFLPGVPEDQAIEKLRRSEDQALEAMFRLLPKSYVQTTEPLKEWLDQFESNLSRGDKASVMWINALIYGLRSGLFESIGRDTEILRRARALLKASRERLAGEVLPENVGLEELTAPLSREVLARFATRKEIIFHNAIFNKSDLKLFERVSQQLNNFIPLKRDYVAALTFMALLFSETHISQGLAGLMVGISFSSFTEFYTHTVAGHSANSKIRKFKEEFPFFGNFIEKWTVAHAHIHHREYSKSFVEKYGEYDPSAPNYENAVAMNKEKGERLTNKLAQKTESISRTVRLSKNGSTFGRPIVNALTFLPFSVGLLVASHIVAPVFDFHPNVYFDIAAFVSSFAFIGATNWYHSRMHVPSTEMLERQNWISRWVMNSRLARTGSRKHAVHHFHGNKEETITPNPIDVLVGTNQPISFEELLLLDRQDALY